MSAKKSFFLLLIILISNIYTPAAEPWQPETCEQIQRRGWNIPGDVNRDCHVNFLDIVDMGKNWWQCVMPQEIDPSCDNLWL